MLSVRRAAMLLPLALMLIPSVVQADRKPTSKERAEVAAVIDLPAQCARVRISTETRKPKWASVGFKPAGSECEAHASDGVTVAKKRAGEWRSVTAGSSFDCPSLYKVVPENVAKDLRITCHQ